MDDVNLCQKLRRLSPSDRKQLFLAPEAVLGPFKDLSRSDRTSLRSAVEQWDAAAIYGYRNRAFWPFVRLLWRLRSRCLRRWKDGRPLGRFLFKVTDEATFAARKSPAWAGRALFRARHVLPYRLPGLSPGTGPVLAPLLSQRVSPHLFAACYCRSIRQRPRYRAFWRDSSTHSTVSCIVGLDLVPTDDGYYVLESNLNPAQRLERTRLYDRDPFADRLVDHAAQAGFDHLCILDNRHEGTNPSTARQYLERANEHGLDLTIVDHPHLPETSHKRGFAIPDDLPPGSLVARLKSYPVSTDHVLTDKFATHRALSLYKETFDEPHLRLPRAGVEPVFGSQSDGSAYPNVVAKRTDSGQGKQVYFARVESSKHAARLFGEQESSRWTNRELADRIKNKVRTPELLFQEYVPPSVVGQGRPYIVRAHVLLTPGDVVFLSAHRVVSNRTVPDRLDAGIVEDPSPYIVNFSSDSGYEILPDREKQPVRRAALAAGRGLAWALRRSFQVEQ